MGFLDLFKSDEQKLKEVDEEINFLRNNLDVLAMWGDKFLNEEDRKRQTELTAKLQKLEQKRKKLLLAINASKRREEAFGH